jgi:hypothetical protein
MLDESALEEQADPPTRVDKTEEVGCRKRYATKEQYRLVGLVSKTPCACPMFGVMSAGQASTLPPALRPFRAKLICLARTTLWDKFSHQTAKFESPEAHLRGPSSRAIGIGGADT